MTAASILTTSPAPRRKWPCLYDVNRQHGRPVKKSSFPRTRPHPTLPRNTAAPAQVQSPPRLLGASLPPANLASHRRHGGVRRGLPTALSSPAPRATPPHVVTRTGAISSPPFPASPQPFVAPMMASYLKTLSPQPRPSASSSRPGRRPARHARLLGSGTPGIPA